MSVIFNLIMFLSLLYFFVSGFKLIKSRKNPLQEGKAKKVFITTTVVFLVSFIGAGATAKPVTSQKEISKVENQTTKVEEKKVEKKENNTFVEAKVSKVVDGDTIEVLVNNQTYKLRMIGIDTPETFHPSKSVQFYGKEASDFTKNNLSDKTVYLQKDVSDTDKYGRLLRYVWIARPSSNEPSQEEIITSMYNAKLVKEGYAHASTYQPDSKYSSIFASLQNEAQSKSLGLWNQTAETEFNSKTTYQEINNVDSSNQNATSQSTATEEAFGHQYTADTTQGKIKGNSSSMIYHVPGGRS
ncbi:thermonuclease family protein [Peptostreptococcus equinus]|uniref:Thermonuclease family protein n=1 Tax=Peptostreptococcus equinus TaxID=3003601 RepID=A0ABY7JNX0_9FIRM|nr:thermonuclease family protein [Peptostreptococcus sp. CBA3647]WAW14571.1 thermonuclease family protein [Peptostreptococcus sp. CBA3647]